MINLDALVVVLAQIGAVALALVIGWRMGDSERGEDRPSGRGE